MTRLANLPALYPIYSHNAHDVQTASAILTFFLMMTLHPEVVNKAYAEIQSVIGSNRLPTIDDRPLLPYIDCVVKEVYRYVMIVDQTSSPLK